MGLFLRILRHVDHLFHDMEGSEEWVEVVVKTDGWGVHSPYDPSVDHWRLGSAAEQEPLQDVREICGEQACWVHSILIVRRITISNNVCRLLRR